ncbi:DUF4202 domain-containing protein [Desertivirga arenae]|uniref:DUF4202 domain-containing protein n=1 Tax=Desertivirga arenae TaxID=2810309 RepID=UPI001A96B528|nr:DUF4202 domain-containing protein [Pedobacter sp. SYSU D00823]
MIKDRLEIAFELFDSYNKQDPNKVTWDGEVFAAEYFYAIKLYEWIVKLEPEASEALKLASRSQHIGRWEIPRDAYPMNKAGYLNWRSNLGKYHAQKAGELMEQAGYFTEEIERVRTIITKQQLKADPEVQTIENALCLVFLEYQFADFVLKHDEDKLIRIIQKTWNKMSDPGRQAALQLQYSELGLQMIQKALSV